MTDTEFAKLHDKLSSIDSTLAAQHIILQEHIRRTELLEKQMEPIRTHVSAVRAILQAVAWGFGTLIAALTAYWTAKKG